jgi:hypothetical protein
MLDKRPYELVIAEFAARHASPTSVGSAVICNPPERSKFMRNFIAALLFAGFAQGLAYAGESHIPEASSSESALPESTESAAAGDSAPSDDETTGEESASESPVELDV